MTKLSTTLSFALFITWALSLWLGVKLYIPSDEWSMRVSNILVLISFPCFVGSVSLFIYSNFVWTTDE